MLDRRVLRKAEGDPGARSPARALDCELVSGRGGELESRSCRRCVQGEWKQCDERGQRAQWPQKRTDVSHVISLSSSSHRLMVVRDRHGWRKRDEERPVISPAAPSQSGVTTHEMTCRARYGLVGVDPVGPVVFPNPLAMVKM